MSTIPMPDPMVEVDKHIVSSELQYTYLAPCGGLEHGTELITTDQAEDYANARVREALEEAAKIVDEYAATDMIVCRIRTLIPKEDA